MKELVEDRSASPLVPGCLLAAISSTQNPRAIRFFHLTALSALNKSPISQVLEVLRSQGLITRDQAARSLALDAQFVSYFRKLAAEIPEIAESAGCASQAVERLACSLFSARLFLEYLEVLVSPDASYEVTPAGTVDLIVMLRETLRNLVGASWRKFFPRDQFGLVADASAQFWTACLDGALPDQMKTNFAGIFRRTSRDRLQALNYLSDQDKGMRITDSVGEYVYSAQKRFNDLHTRLEEKDKREIHVLFAELVDVLGKLNLPPLVIYYFESLVRESCQALSELDGRFSSRKARYLGFLARQLDSVCARIHDTQLLGDPVEEILQEFEQLVGVWSAKEHAKQLARLGRIQQIRRAKGIKPVSVSYNLLFAGSPSTGTTTVALLLGRLYKALGVLRKGRVIECDPSMLGGDSALQTIARTEAIVDEAMDGILLVNDAPSLTLESTGFGQEALRTLLRRLEDGRGRLVVILAGFADQLADFVRSNPRLKQNFARQIEFPDYTPRELSEIFFAMCQRNNLVLADGMHQRVLHHFQSSEATAGKYAYNLQLVRQCFDVVVEAQANRLAACEDIEAQNLNLLVMADLPAIESREPNGVLTAANERLLARGAVRVV